MTDRIHSWLVPGLFAAGAALAMPPAIAQEAATDPAALADGEVAEGDEALELELAAVEPAAPLPPTAQDVTPDVIASLRDFINTEIVRASIVNQNRKYAGMTESRIIELDDKWRAERKSDDQPLISATLTNPLSSYLTRVQAHNVGLYTEMFVMDANGLNVGQSNITSDYWQGDEAKFQKTYPAGPDAVFVDEPEFDDEMGIWRIQVNMAIADETGSQAIGAVTVELNLSELQRRQQMGTL
ncbi:hypothetical protein [Pyruvatibacter mobilis]|jgi:hypothetical protein|uniref:hypothetical protein n=1 Tax=Pyruvatibacter mobilis TaxID=1712261 RepID=UPI003BA95621